MKKLRWPKLTEKDLEALELEARAVLREREAQKHRQEYAGAEKIIRADCPLETAEMITTLWLMELNAFRPFARGPLAKDIKQMMHLCMKLKDMKKKKAKHFAHGLNKTICTQCGLC